MDPTTSNSQSNPEYQVSQLIHRLMDHIYTQQTTNPSLNHNQQDETQGQRKRAEKVIQAILSSSYGGNASRTMYAPTASSSSSSSSAPQTHDAMQYIHSLERIVGESIGSQEMKQIEKIILVMLDGNGSGAERLNSKVLDVFLELVRLKAKSRTGAASLGTSAIFSDLSKSTQANQSRENQAAAHKLVPAMDMDSKKSASIMESRLIRDILFVSQGLDGEVIKYRPESGLFELVLSAQASPSIRDLVPELVELGDLYKRASQLVNYLARIKAQNPIKNAMYIAFEQLLLDHRSRIGVLEHSLMTGEHEATLGLKRVAAWIGQPTRTMQGILNVLSACGYSFNGTSDIKDQTLADGRVVGDLSIIASFHADPHTQKVAKFVFKHCEPAFRNMTRQWLGGGQAYAGSMEWPTDSNGSVNPGSFFIVSANQFRNLIPENSKQTSFAGPGSKSNVGELSLKLWYSNYSVESAGIPCFMSKAVAQNALLIGKSVALLCLGCSDQDYVRQVHHSNVQQSFESVFDQPKTASAYISETVNVKDIETLSQATNSDGLPNHGDFIRIAERYEQVIDQSAKSSCQRLVDVLIRRFGLLDHLHALKSFILLHQSDFVNSLVDALGAQLDRPARSLLRNNLVGEVDSALRSCAAVFRNMSLNQIDTPSSLHAAETDQEEIIRRLDVRLYKTNVDSTVGWDIFSLDYQLDDSPLSIIFHNKAMERYRISFWFAWQLQRVKRALSEIFMLQTLATGNEKHTRNACLSPESRYLHYTVNVLRTHMSHFLNAIMVYATEHILVESWNVMIQRMRAAVTLDEFIAAHDEYQQSITHGWFVSKGFQPVQLEIFNAFQGILELRKWIEKNSRLMNDLLDGAIGLGVDSERIQKQYLECRQELERIYSGFHNARRKFIKFIEALSVGGGVPDLTANRATGSSTGGQGTSESAVDSPNPTDAILSQPNPSMFYDFLLLRLDFNRYYETHD